MSNINKIITYYTNEKPNGENEIRVRFIRIKYNVRIILLLLF